MSARENIPRDWHWPSFEPSICGMNDDRERLGLPDYYVSMRFEEKIPLAYARLRSLSIDKLVEVIQSTEVLLVDRIVAGNLLAVLGDPRISDYSYHMIDVPGGLVSIGLDRTDVEKVLKDFDGLGLQSKWIDKECPRHEVHLNNFKVSKYAVSNSQYKAFLLDTHYHEIPTSWEFRRYPVERSNHPVYTVSPRAADAYVSWIKLKTGIPYRLPTEAEWEWAAAGPNNNEFPWGNGFNAEFANTAETALMTSSSVGAFVGGESWSGLSDMAGNVEEYVANNYLPYPNGQLVNDHLVELNGDYRVARGGSFARFRDLARTKRRHGHNPKSATYAMGFRLACDS
jgi:formylglycine-generating enzyme required for sulfatase activity